MSRRSRADAQGVNCCVGDHNDGPRGYATPSVNPGVNYTPQLILMCNSGSIAVKVPHECSMLINNRGNCTGERVCGIWEFYLLLIFL